MKQLLFLCPSQLDAENAITALESKYPDSFSSISYTRDPDGAWQVTAIFDDSVPPPLNITTDISNLLDDSVSEIDVETVPERDWVTHTLKDLAPVSAGRFLVHGSHDTPYTNLGRIGVLIDAGLAFGTGHHETTQGCLRLLSDLLKRKTIRNACDIGSGTGVLAIAYAKQVRRPVLVTDIDPVAIDVAHENATKNKVTSFLEYAVASGTDHQTIKTGAPYDLILANILARPLRQLANDMRHISARNTRLILSGLLTEQEAGVLGAYRHAGFVLETRCVLGEWSSLLLKRSRH